MLKSGWGLILQTLRTLSSKFGVPPLLGSGAIALQRYSLNVSIIGQLNVLSDSIHCLFYKATVGKISATLISSMTLLLHASFSINILNATRALPES